MNNGNDRLDRAEQILNGVLESLDRIKESQDRLNESLDRLKEANEAESRRFNESMKTIDKRLDYMAARQQYHDEAFERADAELKTLREMVMVDAQNIRALARIAERHQQRLDDIQGEA